MKTTLEAILAMLATLAAAIERAVTTCKQCLADLEIPRRRKWLLRITPGNRGDASIQSPSFLMPLSNNPGLFGDVEIINQNAPLAGDNWAVEVWSATKPEPLRLTVAYMGPDGWSDHVEEVCEWEARGEEPTELELARERIAELEGKLAEIDAIA